MTSSPPRALTIGGSDSGGSAGIQADLKTFMAHGVFGLSALTVITAQNTVGVQAAQALPLSLIAAQIEAVLGDMGAGAVKTGLLGRTEVVQHIAQMALDWPGSPPLVVDPVLVDGQGQPLGDAGLVEAYRRHLLSRATVITPNLDEAALLAGEPPITNRDGLARVARRLYALAYDNAPSGQTAQLRVVVIKGGHLSNPQDETVANLVFDGQTVQTLTYPRLPIDNPHGVGCTLAAALAANLARGQALPAAITHAFNYLQAALAAAQNWQLGVGRLPVNHHYLLPARPPDEGLPD